MKTIGIYTKKGGVGKTQTSADIAVCLSKLNFKVLLVDFDPQRNLNALLNLEDSNVRYSIYNAMQRQLDDEESIDSDKLLHYIQGIYLIPGTPKLRATNLLLQSLGNSESALKEVLKNYESDFDYCIIDCNPHLEYLGKNVLYACDSIIIPTELSYLSALGIADVNNEIMSAKKVNPNLTIEGILYTKVRTNTKAYSENKENFKEGFKTIKVFDSQIPFSTDVENACNVGVNVIDFKGKSKVSIAYKNLTNEILNGGN